MVDNRVSRAGPRVLVVDDVADNCKLLQATLEDEGYEVACAYSGVECLRVAEEILPDLILLDLMMPGMDGIETCEQLKMREALGDVPVVMVSAADEEGMIIRALDAGAHDYICKPIVEPIVCARCRSALRVKQALDENKRLLDLLANVNTQLNQISLQDGLLGIGNRRAMQNDLDQLHSVAERHGRAYGVSLIDVDHFKRYNDRYGHQSGDTALRAVASAIAGSLRETDCVFRYGGEELLVMHPETPPGAGAPFADRICDAVRALRIPHQDSPYHVLTVSVGVAYYTGDDGAGLANKQIVERADQALYAAKKAGRNRACIYGSGDPAVVAANNKKGEASTPPLPPSDPR